MADRIADDFMEVEIDAFEEAEIHIQNIIREREIERENADRDEEAALSDDSGCNSDHVQPEDFLERIVPNAQINALNINTKHCMIEIYYKMEDLFATSSICITCMTEDSDSMDLGIVSIVRRHEIDSYIELRGVYCTSCRKPTFINIPCNVCPICVPIQ